jgi:hypothetical protein
MSKTEKNPTATKPTTKPAEKAPAKPTPPAAEPPAKAKAAPKPQADPKATMQAFIEAHCFDEFKIAALLGSEPLLKECRELCSKLEKRLRTERKNAGKPKAEKIRKPAEKGAAPKAAVPAAVIDARNVQGAPALGAADLKGYYKALCAQRDGKTKTRKC